jgi:hypothetical protein
MMDPAVIGDDRISLVASGPRGTRLMKVGVQGLEVQTCGLTVDRLARSPAIQLPIARRRLGMLL